MDAEENGFAAGLSNCVTRDGQGKPTADLLPSSDNALNLGSGALRWASFNGTPASSVIPTQQGIGGLLWPLTPGEIAASSTPTNYAYPPGNVLRYGADPLGVLDSTAAFNLATFANFSPVTAPSAYKTVHVPAGQYLLKGTVYIPAGTILRGDGMSTYIDASQATSGSANVFRLGWSLVGGTPTKNTIYLTGGYPPEIYGLFFNGGPGSAYCVEINYPGALAHDMWFSQPGTAIYLAGGYFYNCEIDGGLTGMTIGPGINQTVENVRFFNQSTIVNFDVSTGDISDCIFTGCTIEYPKLVGVQIGAGTVSIKGVKFVGCDFINNPASSLTSFVNVVSIANPNTQIEFDACTFHNWGRFGATGTFYAVLVQAAGAVVDLKGCIFDGASTNAAYTLSTNGGAVQLNQGTVRMTDCVIRNLPATWGQGINLGGNSTNVLQIDGLLYSGSGQGSFTITALTAGANAVVTSSSALAVNPFQVGAYLNFAGMTGMTQLNGAEGYITAVGGSIGAWTATTNLDTTGFGAFTAGTALLSLPLLSLTNTQGPTQCYISNVKGDALQPLMNPQSVFPVRLKNATDWFGPMALWPNTGVAYSLVPYGFANLWQAALGANQPGTSSYRKCRLDNIEKDNDFATSNKSFLVQATAVQGANNTNGAVTLTAEFNQPGGTATIALANSGVVAVSWPNTYTAVSIDVQQILAA